MLLFNIAGSAYVTLLFCEKKNFYYNLVHQNEASLLKPEHFMMKEWHVNETSGRMIIRGNDHKRDSKKFNFLISSYEHYTWVKEHQMVT